MRVVRAPRGILGFALACLATACIALATLAGGATLAGCDKPETPSPFPGVRLGMSPRDVRDRFGPIAGGEGTWQTKVVTKPGEDTVLEWTAKDAAATKVPTARFEFHLGMLVAIRAHLNENVAAERIEATEKTVTVRSPAPAGGAGSEVVILARDCPTHKEEAESAASRLKKP